MRKILLTTVGVTALAVSANATDFTLSGSTLLNIDDNGDTSLANTINVGVSKTFDNGMVLSLSQNMNAASAEFTLTSDAVAVTFGDFDQNEKAPGLNGNAAASDISTDGISHTNVAGAWATGTDGADSGSISLGVTVAGVGIGAAMNAEGDTMFGGSFSTDMGGMAVTIGGDVYSDNTSTEDQTTMGISANMGPLVAVVHSKSVEAAKTAAIATVTDVVSYSAAYTAGGLVIGFQGADNDASSYSATYTIVPGMQFEVGQQDDGNNSTSSAQLQMTF